MIRIMASRRLFFHNFKNEFRVDCQWARVDTEYLVRSYRGRTGESPCVRAEVHETRNFEGGVLWRISSFVVSDLQFEVRDS